MGSLLTNRRIDLTFHSATARMSEGNAGANEALRVEFSTFLKLSVGLRTNQGNWLLGKFTTSSAWKSSAQAKGNSFLGKFISNSIGEAPHLPWELFSREVSQKLKCGLRANSGASRTPLHTATGAAFPALGRAPINRQSPQRASSRLERGALWRSLAQPCARKPRNVSV